MSVLDPTDNMNVETEEYGNLYRLPNNIIPLKYKLTLDPDLDGGKFIGDIVMDLLVKESTKKIILNSHELTVKSIRVQDATTESLVHHSVESVMVQRQRQLLIINMDNTLSPGVHTVIMKYSGLLNKESVGLYRTWIGNSGESLRYSMATYFEPTYARFAYPCFDEPHFKAKYLVSLVKPASDDYVALSNSSVKLEVVDYPRPGVTTVHFNETPPISSYLTCFVVGVFQKLESSSALGGSVPVSVYSQPDLVEHTAVARDLAPTILDFFSKYFQIDYPFPKLDLIAIPDSKLSGMENWGLVTFRESALLVSNSEASTVELLTVARIIIHELSHMWFGNLVTIAWWNDTWLKEGMADFMSYIGGNHAFPTWYNEWVFLNTQVFPGLQKDAALSSHPVVQAVSHPDQIREMFDAISYLKGSCLIRMLHDLDSAKFRHGLNKYVHKMKWSDARSKDLWKCLGDSMGWCVEGVMKPWTEQAGYPLITVDRQGKEYMLKQTRFLTGAPSSYDTSTSPHNYLWDIPIKFFTSEDRTVDLSWFARDAETALIYCKPDVKWIKLNWHNVGFFRVNYPNDMWMEFAEMLQQNVSVFDPEDRCNLMNDAWCLAKEGYVQYDVPLSLINYLSEGTEDHFLVWSIVKNHLDKLQSLLSSSNSSSHLFHAYVEKIMAPIVSNLNWETTESVPFMERKLRVELIELACLLGFDSVLEKVRTIFSDWIDKKKLKPCAELRTVVHTYGLSGNQNEELWEKTWQQYLIEHNPTDILNYLRSLASTTDPKLISRLFEEAKNPDVVRSQDFFILLGFISKSSIGNKMVWDFLRSEWEYLVKRFSVNDLHLGHIVSFVVSRFSSPEELAQVEDFFSMYPDAGAGATERKHALETIKANIRWKNVNNEFLDAWFSKI